MRHPRDAPLRGARAPSATRRWGPTRTWVEHELCRTRRKTADAAGGNVGHRVLPRRQSMVVLLKARKRRDGAGADSHLSKVQKARDSRLAHAAGKVLGARQSRAEAEEVAASAFAAAATAPLPAAPGASAARETQQPSWREWKASHAALEVVSVAAPSLSSQLRPAAAAPTVDARSSNRRTRRTRRASIDAVIMGVTAARVAAAMATTPNGTASAEAPAPRAAATEPPRSERRGSRRAPSRLDAMNAQHQGEAAASKTEAASIAPTKEHPHPEPSRRRGSSHSERLEAMNALHQNDAVAPVAPNVEEAAPIASAEAVVPTEESQSSSERRGSRRASRLEAMTALHDAMTVSEEDPDAEDSTVGGAIQRRMLPMTPPPEMVAEVGWEGGGGELEAFEEDDFFESWAGAHVHHDEEESEVVAAIAPLALQRCNTAFDLLPPSSSMPESSDDEETDLPPPPTMDSSGDDEDS